METLFIKLPFLILVNIISRLSDKDKTNLALTNKQWFQIMVENKWNGKFMRISDTILKSFPNLKPLGMTLNTIPNIIPKVIIPKVIIPKVIIPKVIIPKVIIPKVIIPKVIIPISVFNIYINKNQSIKSLLSLKTLHI
jgi:hypothetical protein